MWMSVNVCVCVYGEGSGRYLDCFLQNTTEQCSAIPIQAVYASVLESTSWVFKGVTATAGGEQILLQYMMNFSAVESLSAFLSNTYYSRMFTTYTEAYLFNCTFSSPCLSTVLRDSCVSLRKFLMQLSYVDVSIAAWHCSSHPYPYFPCQYLFLSLYLNATSFPLLNNLKTVGRSILLFIREFFKVCTFFCSSFFWKQVKKYLSILYS